MVSGYWRENNATQCVSLIVSIVYGVVLFKSYNELLVIHVIRSDQGTTMFRTSHGI